MIRCVDEKSECCENTSPMRIMIPLPQPQPTKTITILIEQVAAAAAAAAAGADLYFVLKGLRCMMLAMLKVCKDTLSRDVRVQSSQRLAVVDFIPPIGGKNGFLPLWPSRSIFFPPMGGKNGWQCLATTTPILRRSSPVKDQHYSIWLV